MAFLPDSRYAKTPTVVAKTDTGREVKAVKLRPLPRPSSVPHRVDGSDRLDRITSVHYGDGERFWHVADANTELQANALTDEVGRIIDVPEQS